MDQTGGSACLGPLLKICDMLLNSIEWANTAEQLEEQYYNMCGTTVMTNSFTVLETLFIKG